LRIARCHGNYCLKALIAFLEFWPRDFVWPLLSNRPLKFCGTLFLLLKKH
jgi:hypothetical protein